MRTRKLTISSTAIRDRGAPKPAALHVSLHHGHHQPHHARHPRRRRRKLRSRLPRLLIITLTVILWSCSFCFCCTHALAAVDFETMKIHEWTTLFQSTSAAMQLPELYRLSPRVRAKLLVAKSLTFNELVSQEATLRQRLSEIASVSADRVVIESVETNAIDSSVRGAYAVSVGFSALSPPPTASPPSEATTDLISDRIDAERQRILNSLQYGRMDASQPSGNVTLASVRLFGWPTQLLSAHLDGESFYPIDTTPWVGVRLVLATAETTKSSVAVVSPSSLSSSTVGHQIDAFQNLRLRFLFARFLRRLQVESSSILIRDAWSPSSASQQYHYNYGTPGGAATTANIIIVPIQVHIGDDASLRMAVDGLLRNSSLAMELQEILPQWTLVAVDVDDSADVLSGKATAQPPPQPPLPVLLSPSVQQVFEITLRVDRLPLTHVERRQYAIQDATHVLLTRAQVLSGDTTTCAVSVGGVAMVNSGTDVSEIALSSATSVGDDYAAQFYISSSASDPLAPIDRAFLLRLHITCSSSSSSTTTADAIHNALAVATASPQDARVALGFVGGEELFTSTSTTAQFAVQYQTTTHLEQGTATTATPSGGGGSSFVEIVLAVTARRELLPSAGSSSAVSPVAASLDSFALYQLRCALLFVLERVFVSDRDLALTMLAPLDLSSSSSTTMPTEVEFRVYLHDETQRDAIASVMDLGSSTNRRFQRTLSSYTRGRLELLTPPQLRLYADGSTAQRIKLPGTSRVVPRDAPPPPTTATIAPVVKSSTDYVFGDPVLSGNPSVVSDATAQCPSTTSTSGGSSGGPQFLGCLVLRWASAFPMHSLLLRRLRVFPSGITLQSSNLVLPAPSTGRISTAVLPPAAPWIRATDATDTPSEWTLQIFTNDSSTSHSVARNVTLQLWLEVADNSSFYPAFQLTTELSVAPTTAVDGSAAASPSSPLLQLVSFRRQPSELVPLTPVTAPLLVVQQITNAFVTVATIDNTQPSTGVNATVTLTQHAALGLIHQPSTTSSSCGACQSLLDACRQQRECSAIATCVRSAVDQQLTLFDELLLQLHQQQPPASSDMTHVLQSCLSSSPLAASGSSALGWSTSGRAAFISGLRCVLQQQQQPQPQQQSSCPIATSPALARALSLRYLPRYQIIRIVSTQFPILFQFLIDIRGGQGASVDGQTWTKSYGYIHQVTSDTLTTLRDILLSLYGPFARAMDVVVTSSPVFDSSVMEIRIEYYFMDTGVVGMPFITVTSASASEPSLPTIESNTSESLTFVASATNPLD